LGDGSPGTFELTISLPGARRPEVFPNLKCQPGFKRLDWVGFIANGQQPTTFYVDDIEVTEERG